MNQHHGIPKHAALSIRGCGSYITPTTRGEEIGRMLWLDRATQKG
jgi:hypothetical protein